MTLAFGLILRTRAKFLVYAKSSTRIFLALARAPNFFLSAQSSTREFPARNCSKSPPSLVYPPYQTTMSHRNKYVQNINRKSNKEIGLETQFLKSILPSPQNHLSLGGFPPIMFKAPTSRLYAYGEWVPLVCDPARKPCRKVAWVIGHAGIVSGYHWLEVRCSEITFVA